MTTRNPKIPPMHPGELLAEIVFPATGESADAIAERLGVSRPALHNLLRRQQGVTPALALRLGRLFGNGPEFWLNLQRDFDLWHFERRLTLQRDFDLWHFERELRAELAEIRPIALREHVRELQDEVAEAKVQLAPVEDRKAFYDSLEEGGTVVDRPPRIGSVVAQPPSSVLVTWSEGERSGVTETINLTPILFRFTLYRPLHEDPELFRSVRVIAEGTALAWGDEIDLGATALLELAGAETEKQRATKACHAAHHRDRPTSH